MAIPLLTAIPLIGTVLDKAIDLFTGDDKKQAELVLEQIKNGHLQVMGQQEITKAEASHSSVWVAGARPFILWICGASIGFYFIPQFAIGAYFYALECWKAQAVLPYPLDTSGLMELVYALLGLGAYRTVEKIKGVAR